MEDTASLLIVEDDEASRELLLRRLQRKGYEVAAVADGQEALARLAARNYDLVLLDVDMPGMDGLEVLRRIRAATSATELPVILTTSRDSTIDAVAGLETGANDYLTKPLDFQVVKARVRMQLRLKRAVDRIRQLEREVQERNAALEGTNQRMRADLEAAARIQEAMLPASLPDRPGAKFAWLFKPSAELAGDALNVFALDEDHVGFYVLDVVGHGFAAALLSVAVSRVLTPSRDSFLVRPIADPPGYRILEPREVAEQLNRRFPFDSATEQFFSILYGVVDVRTRELNFVTAGHPGPIHVARGSDAPRLIASRERLPIGIGDRAYPEHSMLLEPGDRLVIYSDGIPDAMNAAAEAFGAARMIESLARSRDVPLEQSLAALWSDVERWCGSAPREDDASLVALEITAQH